jgi:HAD superfamily hydrolase (TIGR01549 family)
MCIRLKRSRRSVPGRSNVIIFDFDQTLVDTQPVEALRTAGKWRAVMAQAPQLKVYGGINELLANLHKRGQKLAIVTTSPDMVPKAFIKQHKWPIDIVVGFHQVRRRKPDPEGLILAMTQAGAKSNETFHVGDQAEDTFASRAANVTAIGSAWGLTDLSALKASEPDYLFTAVDKLQSFLFETL